MGWGSAWGGSWGDTYVRDTIPSTPNPNDIWSESCRTIYVKPGTSIWKEDNRIMRQSNCSDTLWKEK